MQNPLEPKKEEEIEPKIKGSADTKSRKFFIMSTYGEILDLAIHLEKVEKEEVVFTTIDPNYGKIGDGIVTKDKNWHNYIGKDYIWVIDGCEHADLQDWLRNQGEFVVGTDKMMSEYEEERQMGQKWFKDAGFYQPESHNFKDIDQAIDFVREHTDKQWILKQNGDAPKHLNHKGHFEGNEDMIFHLEELKKTWNNNEWGTFDCDLMEVANGMEVAVSAFWNGFDFLCNKEGKVVGYINHEQKKESDGNLGVMTGEMGTIFLGVDEDNELFQDVILKEKIIEKLKESNFRGVFDINCIVTDKGIVGLEPTSRFGVPATSYEFMEGLEAKTADLLEAMAKGLDTPIDVNRDFGIVQVVVAPPFPTEAEVEETATSLGEKLWIINNGKPTRDFNKEQMKHIHLENFLKDDEGNYKVASKNGYLLTITQTGKTIEDVREKSIEYIKDNIYISDMKYRMDLGEDIEQYYE